MNRAEEPEVVSTSPLTEEDKIILQIAENAILKAPERITDFAKLMITLMSGFFAVYFALLKFLGVTSARVTNVVSPWLVWPPILLIISIILFVLVGFPVLERISLESPSVTLKGFDQVLFLRYILALVGTTLFVSALIVTAYVSLQLLA